jgi:hypothetical protein
MQTNDIKLPFVPGQQIYIEAEYIKEIDYVDDDGPGYVEGAMLMVAGKTVCVRADALRTFQSQGEKASDRCGRCGWQRGDSAHWLNAKDPCTFQAKGVGSRIEITNEIVAEMLGQYRVSLDRQDKDQPALNSQAMRDALKAVFGG